jgi:hypothetical protein
MSFRYVTLSVPVMKKYRILSRYIWRTTKISYIFDCRKFTLDLESRDMLSYAIFSEEQLRHCMTKLYSLRYCDLHDCDGNFLSIAQIGELLNTAVTPLQVFQLRNVCTVARVRYSKKVPSMQNSIHIETFLFRKKKGSSHIRKILSAKAT